MDRRAATAEASLAAMRARKRLGMAIAAITRITATTINSSIREKPICFVRICCGPPRLCANCRQHCSFQLAGMLEAPHAGQFRYSICFRRQGAGFFAAAWLTRARWIARITRRIIGATPRTVACACVEMLVPQSENYEFGAAAHEGRANDRSRTRRRTCSDPANGSRSVVRFSCARMGERAFSAPGAFRITAAGGRRTRQWMAGMGVAAGNRPQDAYALQLHVASHRYAYPALSAGNRARSQGRSLRRVVGEHARVGLV